MPKKSLQESISHLPFLKHILLAIFINIALITIILLIRNTLPPEVPLYYGRPQGSEQLADRFSLIIPPLFSLAVIFINITLIQFIKEAFLRYVLVSMMFVLTSLSLITVLKIINIVASF